MRGFPARVKDIRWREAIRDEVKATYPHAPFPEPATPPPLTLSVPNICIELHTDNIMLQHLTRERNEHAVACWGESASRSRRSVGVCALIRARARQSCPTKPEHEKELNTNAQEPVQNRCVRRGVTNAVLAFGATGASAATVNDP